MNQKPIILVTGATGAQGGSVALALMSSGKYHVRCLTRNKHSEKALALKRKGAEIVEGDLGNIESLKSAMRDCYGVFGLTNFWEHYEEEALHGKNLVKAVHASGIPHFVFSSLPGYHTLSGGKFPVPHCDIKASLENFIKRLGLPATFIHIAFYYENFLSFFPPQPDGNGGYYFGFPQGDTKLAMVSAEDLGKIVAKIFDHPLEYLGRTVGVVGENRTCTEYAAIMSSVLQRDIKYHYIPRDVYAAFDFAGAEELANMFEVQRLFIPERTIDLIESYGLNPSMQTFESWLFNNRQKFHLPSPIAEAAY
ncbi:MAG: NmrA/HSCARG family protein [Agriterribacter sp.]